MSQLDLSYYLRNVLEMTGCFNSACSAIIREKWMLFAYFYYAQFSFMKLASSFLGFLFLCQNCRKENNNEKDNEKNCGGRGVTGFPQE